MAYLHQSERIMHKRGKFGTELVPGYSKSIIRTLLYAETDHK